MGYVFMNYSWKYFDNIYSISIDGKKWNTDLSLQKSIQILLQP